MQTMYKYLKFTWKTIFVLDFMNKEIGTNENIKKIKNIGIIYKIWCSRGENKWKVVF